MVNLTDNDRITGPLAPGDGATALATDFPVFDADDLVVLKRASGGDWQRLAEGVDYTVSGLGQDAGATVTLTQPATVDDEFLLVGSIKAEPELQLVYNQQVPSAGLNREIDRLWAAIQELRRASGLRAAPGAKPVLTPAAEPQMTLPPQDTRAGLLLEFDDTGAPRTRFRVSDLGNIETLNWRGPWLAGASYARPDVVQHNGAAYVCVAPHVADAANAPPGANWELLAQATPNVPDGSITTVKLADGAVTEPKLEGGLRGRIAGVAYPTINRNYTVLYVSPTGDDANDGLSPTTPFQTIQHAVIVATSFYGNCKILVAPGTYNEDVWLRTSTAENGLEIEGQTGNPSDVVIRRIGAIGPLRAHIRYVELGMSGVGLPCLECHEMCSLWLIRVNFYGSGHAGILVNHDATCTLAGGQLYTLKGSFYAFVDTKGFLRMNSVNIDVQGDVTGQFIVSHHGVVEHSSVTYSGATITGSRYWIGKNTKVFGDLEIIPASSPGYTEKPWEADFVSGWVAFNGATAPYGWSVQHGLGVVPSRVDIYARCEVAEHGFNVGDVIPIGAGARYYQISSIRMTSTEVSYVNHGNTNFFYGSFADGSSSGYKNPNNWSMKFYVWR